MTRPRLIVCMGVSGCGKSTVARAIADSFGVAMLEGDDFHPAENRARMASGKPLTDAMREPWIERIVAALRAEAAAGHGCVLACSALRRTHRQRLREAGLDTRFLWLDGTAELLTAWMEARAGHFMPASLLESQFEALEPPVDEADAERILLSADWAAPLKRALEAARRFLSE